MSCQCQSSALCRLHYVIAELTIISGRVPERVALALDSVIDMLKEEINEKVKSKDENKTD